MTSVGGRQRAVVVLWLLVAALYLLTGLLAYVDPPTFVAELADFGRGGEHYVRDIGAAQVALGALAGAAALRRPWRPLVTGVIALHLVLHAVAHVVDRHRGTSTANRLVLAALVTQAVALVLAWRLDRRR